jgi:hypothetical protein
MSDDDVMRCPSMNMAQRHLFCNELELEIMYVQNALDAGMKKERLLK